MKATFWGVPFGALSEKEDSVVVRSWVEGCKAVEDLTSAVSEASSLPIILYCEAVVDRRTVEDKTARFGEKQKRRRNKKTKNAMIGS
jgi:hypothetical protein